MTEPIRWLICKCGEEIEDVASPETEVCPSCKRWGCWSVELQCPRCESYELGNGYAAGDTNHDDPILACADCDWNETMVEEESNV